MTAWYNFYCTYGLLVTLILMFKGCSTYEFSKDYTGVYFSPWVKRPYTEGADAPETNNYTMKEIEVMLDVISEKFSKVATYGAGSTNVSYQRDVTFQHESTVEAYISKEAANINHRRGKNIVTILQGIQYYDYNPQMLTEVKLAIESAQKANQIFPGTVGGFQFTTPLTKSNLTQASETLGYLHEVKNSSAKNLMFGTDMDFDLLNGYILQELDEELMQIVKKILKVTNFVVCSIEASDEKKSEGVKAAFDTVGKAYLKLRTELLNTTKNLHVIADLWWESNGDKEWNTLKNMKTFWELADQGAQQYKFPIIFEQAFDTPFNTEFAHGGWWKLIDNSRSEQKAGYMEKILELKSSSAMATMEPTRMGSILMGITGILVFRIF